ncbi:MAG: hypothetical protein Kow0042_01590 [Calditrichia bacterium]
MRFFQLILILILVGAFFSIAGNQRTWIQVTYDSQDPLITRLVMSGIIESEPTNSNVGWMREIDFVKWQDAVVLHKMGSDLRRIETPQIISVADSFGQVLAVYPLPAEVEAAIGLGYQDGYFYLSDFTINKEKIYKLDPVDSFRVVKTFPAPGSGTRNPWGVTSNGRYLFIADGIQDAIFKVDTSGALIGSFPAPGPLASGLGYFPGTTPRLWNADLGDFIQGIPPAMYVTDTLGMLLNTYILSNTTNGVAAHDSAIFIGRNKNTGKVILVYDPSTFIQTASFPSPLEFPNGLAFDGQYLWIAGRDQGENYIVQVDLGITPPPPPPPVQWNTFTLVSDGMFNNRFHAGFDSEGKVHFVYATQFETVSETKEIMYGTNRRGVWELVQITNDSLTDEVPDIFVDGNDVVHLIWNGYVPAEGDVEIFYANNSSGEFLPKIQITSRSLDGIEGHAYPDIRVADDGTVHFTFTSFPQFGLPEVYYATYSQGTTTQPVQVSFNSAMDTDPQILLDLQGYPHIFWNDYSSGLRHATNASGSWASEAITPMGISKPGVGIDGLGNFHFAVTQSNTVKYGNNRTGNFAVTYIVGTHAASCFHCDLQVDSEDNVHVVYHAFGDSVNIWPGRGEIFYSNNFLWEAGDFPQNISQLVDAQEVYPGLAVKDFNSQIAGWARMGSTEGIFSDIRVATTLPDSGGFLAGKINTSADSFHYGYIAPLDTAYWEFTIYNTGVRPLTVQDILWESPSSPPFTVFTNFTGPQTLAWGDTVNIQVVATIEVPVRDTVEYSGNLRILSDDPVEPEKTIFLQAESDLSSVGDKPIVRIQNELFPNYPNPFNPVTTIEFQIAKFGLVKLVMYDLLGREVKTLVNKWLPAGLYTLHWDGTDDAGHPVASGVYLYRLQAGSYTVVRKMLLLR